MSRVDQFPTQPRLEEYKKRFENSLFLERKNGILLARMHTDGGPVRWSPFMHRELVDAWATIGCDLDNEVLIVTATGDFWFAMHDRSAFHEWDENRNPDLRYDGLRRPLKSVENFIYGIDIPTIGVINGPGPSHMNFGLMCDITLAATDVVFRDHHFNGDMIPGDSIGLLMQQLLGIKRGNALMYSLTQMTAKEACDLGLVNEVLPRDKLMDRAWEIGAEIMKQHRATRRLTSLLVKRPMRRMVFEDYQQHIGMEMYGYVLQGAGHEIDKLRAKFTPAEKRFEEELIAKEKKEGK
jgi:enoyl-CoA hydratase/carnithine racemase